MLNRQKTLLCLLRFANRPVSKLELTKWAFVLSQEASSGGGNAFYSFLPYKFGPFSFCLYREMDGLVRDGYVEAQGDTDWTVTSLADDVIPSLSAAIRGDGQRIVKRFVDANLDAVIDYVYDRYPRYTVNSQRKKLAQRHVASTAVYTSGYEGLSVDGFLDRLIRHGIQRIVDVRKNPVARRYGFHKSTLSRLAGHVQIEYLHLPQLGISSELRENLDSPEDYQALLDAYEATTLRQETGAVEQVANLLQEKASVLVCMEADPRFCHRSRIANKIAEKTGLPLQHLEYRGK